MKYRIFLIMLLFSRLAVAQQPTAPDWTDAVRRDLLYPSNQYYTGLAISKIEKVTDMESVLNRLKNSARAEMVSSILVTVNQTTERYLENRQVNQSAQTIDIFRSGAVTESGIKDIPGLNVETWYNPKTGDAMAFAWVKTSDLIRKLGKRITINVTKAELAISTVEEHIAKGNKSEAKQILSSLSVLFSDMENDQKVMLSMDATLEDEDIAFSEVNGLKKKFQQLQIDLKNGISIYIVCTAKTLTDTYPALQNAVKGELVPLGCSFVQEATASDWVITISATAREYNTQQFANVTSYFAFVDALLSIQKTATNQTVYEDVLSVKGSHTLSYNEAVRAAYKDMIPQLGEIITNQIQ